MQREPKATPTDTGSGGAGQSEGTGGESAKPRRKRGRPGPQQSTKQDDERLYDAWKSGHYRTQKDMATEIGRRFSDVSDGIERHRKRLERRTKSGA